MTLLLKKSQYEDIVTHSRETYPTEACGLLVGLKRGKDSTVLEVRRTPNVLKSSSRYEVSPEAELQVFIDADKNSLDVVGIYHSHPYWHAAPSDVDASLAFMKDVSYVIYSVSENSLAAFNWNGSTFQKEDIQIEQ